MMMTQQNALRCFIAWKMWAIVVAPKRTKKRMAAPVEGQYFHWLLGSEKARGCAG